MIYSGKGSHFGKKGVMACDIKSFRKFQANDMHINSVSSIVVMILMRVTMASVVEPVGLKAK